MASIAVSIVRTAVSENDGGGIGGGCMDRTEDVQAI